MIFGELSNQIYEHEHLKNLEKYYKPRSKVPPTKDRKLVAEKPSVVIHFEKVRQSLGIGYTEFGEGSDALGLSMRSSLSSKLHSNHEIGTYFENIEKYFN